MTMNNPFPNDLGNYKGKRKSKPTPAALSPRERFYRLAATHETYARPYRWKSLLAK
jgi:hypothetical protein